jgi:hypothetical protein
VNTDRSISQRSKTKDFWGSFGYLTFTITIYAVGFALITLGHQLRNHRRTDAVLLDS